jgi:hypothetical protein
VSRVTPVSPERLVADLAERIASVPGTPWLRVGIDGAPSAGPRELADALVAPLRVRGRPAIRVDAQDFLRPASTRLELGRRNPDAYYERWYDRPALSREVLRPLGPGGTGRILPTYWNPVTDRSTRAGYVEVPPGGVLLLSGPLLLGRALTGAAPTSYAAATGLELDLTVHCGQSAAALERRTPEEDRWTLPAFARYAEEVGPEYLADVAVRVDDPRHPALVVPGPVAGDT